MSRRKMVKSNNRATGCTRRDFVIGAMTVAGLGALGAFPVAAGAMTDSLRECAAGKGIVFGSAVSADSLKDSAYADLVIGQCGIVVPESELKWAALRPAPDRYDFTVADSLYNFAHDHRMLFRGHTLVWEQALPKWFSGAVNAGNAQSMMVDHISHVMHHYQGKMHSWDVVNEAFQLEDGRSDGLKNTPWLRFLGPQYIETAFQAAHRADPQAMLVYNENWLEPDDAMTEKKRQCVLTMLRDFKKRNVPIHALGIQSHIYAETNVTGQNYRRFLDQVSDLGLAILITEMDIREKNPPLNVELRDRAVSDQYFNYLSFMLECKAVKAVLTWGLSDRYTWISYSNPDPFGLPVRPLPYDAHYRPALARDAIFRALQSAPKREQSV